MTLYVENANGFKIGYDSDLVVFRHESGVIRYFYPHTESQNQATPFTSRFNWYVQMFQDLENMEQKRLLKEKLR